MLVRGVTLDAVGVLISPREAVGVAYHRALEMHDKAAAAATSPAAIAARYRRAYNNPRLHSAGSSSRFHADFWMGIVRESTGSSCPRVFEEIYDYFSSPAAWGSSGMIFAGTGSRIIRAIRPM